MTKKMNKISNNTKLAKISIIQVLNFKDFIYGQKASVNVISVCDNVKSAFHSLSWIERLGSALEIARVMPL